MHTLPYIFCSLYSCIRSLSSSFFSFYLFITIIICKRKRAVIKENIYLSILICMAGKSVIISNQPYFYKKAELFPGSAFVIGADTAVRLIDVSLDHWNYSCSTIIWFNILRVITLLPFLQMWTFWCFFFFSHLFYLFLRCAVISFIL